MEVLRFSFGAVGPIILLIALGLLLRARGLIGEGDIGPLTNLAFKVFMPLMTFNNLADVDFTAEFSAGLTAFALLGVCGLTAGLWLGLRPLVRDRQMHGALVHLLYRSNFLVLGTALMGNLYGNEGVRIASMLVPVAVIPFNLFGVLVLSAAGAGVPKGGRVKTILKDVASNNLILACVLGALWSLTGLSMPGVVDSALRSAGAMGSPLTIILLGAQLDFQTLRSNIRLIVLTTVGRLVLIPGVMVALAVALGFRGIQLCALFVLFGAPSATTAAIMARYYNVKPLFSAQIVVVTSSLCCLTLFLGLSLLRAVGLL